MPGTDTITVYRGEDVDLEFTLDPVEDITGWTIEFFGGGFTKAATITNAAQGEFRVSLVDTDTEPLSAGRYQYDVWRTDQGSERVLAIGNFDVTATERSP